MLGLNPLAVVAAWLAYLSGVVAGGAARDGVSFATAAVTGAVLVLAGYAAGSRTRAMAGSDNSTRLRRAALAAAAGVAHGVANLAANWLIAIADPALRSLLVQRFTGMDPIIAVVAAPLREEVIFRLFLLSAFAWVASRLTKDPFAVFLSALLASSMVFAVMHLGRAMPADPTMANFYRIALVVKYSVLGLPLGWLFWRWGLPYAILCHAASNAAHLVMQRAVF